MAQIRGIPATPAEVTPAWIEEALRAGDHLGAAAVAEVSVETIGEGLGMLSQLARLRLDYEESDGRAPAAVVLKLASAFPPARQLAAENRWYEREVGFYRDLAPLGGVPAPICYWCDFETTTGLFALLLEDLTPLVCEDQVVGIGRGRLDAAVACLADLHAHWWDSPALSTYDWLPAGNWAGTHAVIEGYRQLWGIFLDRFGSALPEGAMRFGEAAADAMHGIIDDVARRPVTLAHTDFRLDNLFFDARDAATGEAAERVVAIDWQLVTQTVGTFDVAYLLTQSTSSQQRRDRQWDILRSWHDRVTSKVDTPYSYDDAVADYRRSALICLLYPVVGGAQLDPGNERGERLWTTIAERAFGAADDLGLQELL